jgi:hypothetical protein
LRFTRRAALEQLKDGGANLGRGDVIVRQTDALQQHARGVGGHERGRQGRRTCRRLHVALQRVERQKLGARGRTRLPEEVSNRFRGPRLVQRIHVDADRFHLHARRALRRHAGPADGANRRITRRGRQLHRLQLNAAAVARANGCFENGRGPGIVDRGRHAVERRELHGRRGVALEQLQHSRGDLRLEHPPGQDLTRHELNAAAVLR